MTGCYCGFCASLLNIGCANKLQYVHSELTNTTMLGHQVLLLQLKGYVVVRVFLYACVTSVLFLVVYYYIRTSVYEQTGDTCVYLLGVDCRK